MKNKLGVAFYTLVCVFFFWGFVAASNDILIPVLKEHLDLTQSQSQLISFAFYIAYTVGSLLYYFISKFLKMDLVNKIGYKNALVYGLIISAIGTLFFYPAAENSSFILMIVGLFIVGLGFSLQQTVANPLAILLGEKSLGAQRLSLAGGINNFGSIIGPALVSFAIFGKLVSGSYANSVDIASVKIPYLILGACFLLVALLFHFSAIPNKVIITENNEEQEGKNSALKYPQLVLGMVAIFTYVGVEVATAANLPEFMKVNLGYSTEMITPFVSLYWASLMIGRWTAAMSVLKLSKLMNGIMKMMMPFIAFGVFLYINHLFGYDILVFKYYPLLICVLIGAEFFTQRNPSKQLLVYSVLSIVALFTGMFTNGMVAVYAFMSVGLFCSTLWPCIFDLALTNLGKQTSQGSMFLIMMIMGGGVMSLLQGFISEIPSVGIQLSYGVGVVCFLYLVFYAIWFQVNKTKIAK